jgi:tetratricopeptide (TPR) repeat protein
MNTTRAMELQESAWACHSRGELDQARDLTLEALRLVQTVEGPASHDAANLLNELAELELDRADLGGAWAFARQAHEVEVGWRDAPSSDDATRIRVKTSSVLGSIRQAQGRYQLAEAHLTEALALARELGDGSEEAALARNALGVLYKFWGRFEDALSLYERALDALSALHGEDSLAVGVVLHNIGGARHAQGRFSDAAEPGRKAWLISRAHLGATHPRALADATAYAAILDGLERYAECETICRDAHAALESSLGPDHYEVASTLHNLAAAVEAQGRAEEAEQLYRRALAQKLRLLGEDHPDVALTCNNLGRLLIDMGRVDESVQLLETAVAILDNRLLPSHPARLAATSNLERAVAALSQVDAVRQGGFMHLFSP